MADVLIKNGRFEQQTLAFSGTDTSKSFTVAVWAKNPTDDTIARIFMTISDWDNDVTTSITATDSDENILYTKSGLAKGETHDLQAEVNIEVRGETTITISLSGAPGGEGGNVLISGYAENDVYITEEGVTYEALENNNDIGQTSNTVAAGNDSRFPSPGEKSAFAGTSGTPGGENRYVTDADQRNTNARTPTSHNNTYHSETYITASALNAYAFLAGRAGGQTLIGGIAEGENLTLQSSSHATKGKIFFGTSVYDEVNNRLGIKKVTPLFDLDVEGIICCNATLRTLSTTLNLLSSVADGAAATGIKIGNLNALTVSGAKILSIYSDNFISEKASLTKDGHLNITGILYFEGNGGGLSYNSKNTLQIGYLTGGTGYQSIALGYASSTGSGSYCNALASYCGYGNAGDYTSFLSYFTGWYNKGNYATFLGAYAGHGNFKSNVLYCDVDGAKSFLPVLYAESQKIRIHGDEEIVNPATLGSECLSETDFVTHAKWDVSGNTDDSGGNCVFSGVGTLTQTSGNLANGLQGNRWYKLVYTISSPTGTPAAIITTGIAEIATSIRVSEAGTWDCLIYTKATPGDFVISCTAGNFTIDDISLKEIQGGSLKIRKDLIIYGTSIMSPNLKSGATQGAAGAAAGELWCDTASNNVVKLGV